MSDEYGKPKLPRPSRPDFPIEEAVSGTLTRLDERLIAYLNEHEWDKQQGHTIANLRVEVHQVQMDVRELGLRVRTVELRQDRHGQAIREIKQQLAMGADVDTGVHQLEDLRKHLAQKEAERALHPMQEELKQRRNESVWWRRKKTELFFAATGTVVALGLGGFGTLLWYILTHPVKP